MSFVAPYAFTGAVSLYLGYRTYSSYYSNLEFEEVNVEDIDNISKEKEIEEKLIEETNPVKETIEETIEETNPVEETKPIEETNSIELVKPITREYLNNEGKKRCEQIKIIVDEVKDEIEELSYRMVDEVIEKALERIEEEDKKVVLSEEIPETVFPEVEKVISKNNQKKKKKKKKNNKKK